MNGYDSAVYPKFKRNISISGLPAINQTVSDLMVPASTAERALILGTDERALLGVVRSLGRRGINCHLLGPCRSSVINRSRYLTKLHDLKGDGSSSLELANQIAALMQTIGFELVLPCNDSMQIAVQTHQHYLRQFGLVAALPKEVFEVVSNKIKISAIARSNGINVAKEAIVYQLDDAEYIKGNLQLPVVLKPVSSHDLVVGGPRRVVRKAFSWAEFESIVSDMLRAGPVAVQENFAGVGVGIELLLDDGKPILEFQHLRLHEPLHGGGSSYRQGIPIDSRIRDASLQLLSPLHFTGVVMVEFKFNLKTGEWAFIEINPRFWGSLPLAIASGADFPYRLYRLLVHGERTLDRRPRHGLCCRNWSRDFWWQIENFKADKTNQYLLTRSARTIFWETIKNVALVRERSDTFVLDDPIPGVAEACRMFLEVVDRVGSRIRRSIYSSVVSRPFLRMRAIKRFQRTRTVLFVCRGNICRSPFAEYYARSKLADNVNFDSAGFLLHHGRSAPPNAASAAHRFDINLATHRSKLVSREFLSRADMIFVFDYFNYQQLMASYREFKHKVSFLGAATTGMPLYIDDPNGADHDVFVSTYQRIKLAIDELVRGRAAWFGSYSRAF